MPKHLRPENLSSVFVGALQDTADELEAIWAPPPVMDADHPSAPVPRLVLPDDHPSGPMSLSRPHVARHAGGAEGWSSPPSHDLPRRSPAGRENGGPGPRGSGTFSPGGPGRARRPGRHAAVAGGGVRRDTSRIRRSPGPARRDTTGYQERPGFQRSTDTSRETGPGFQPTTDYGRETGPLEPGVWPANEGIQDGPATSNDSLQTAGQILEAAQREAVAITEQATAQALAIREAAEREAAEVRARLESMFGELGRMVTDYFDEMLAAPAMPTTGMPTTGMPTTGMPTTAVPAAGRPASTDTMPGAAPRIPETRPAPGAKSTRRGTTSAHPAAKPVGRQAKAMKKMAAAFVVASLIGAVSGTTELMLHGYPFFIFRANGAGATETGPREPASPPKAGQSFLSGAHHRPAAHHSPTTSKK
ncbi:MAG TPA: hypothetical protein VEV61_14485 [Streptosporangiaceae bacterium]|nr:hypothetical protein [Streptosporangiaceae bacterium]